MFFRGTEGKIYLMHFASLSAFSCYSVWFEARGSGGFALAGRRGEGWCAEKHS